MQCLLNGLKLGEHVFHWPVVIKHFFNADKLPHDVADLFAIFFFSLVPAIVGVFSESLYEIYSTARGVCQVLFMASQLIELL